MTGATLTCVSREGRALETALDACLTPADRETIRADANAWIKRLRLADYGGVSMRDRFTYRGDSLWWFTELYLHKMRRFEAALATITALEGAIALHQPARMIVTSNSAAVREAARAFGASRKLPIEVRGGAAGAGPASAWSSYVIGLTSRLPRWRPAGAALPARHPAIAAFVHTAFWRSNPDSASGGQETYIGPVLDAVAKQISVGDLHFVGVGPRRNFRARRWWDPIARSAAPSAITPVERLAPAHALSGSIDLWRQRDALAAAITTGDGIRSAAVAYHCDLWAVVEPELQDAARLQWTWSARAMDEAGAALDALAPQVALTYAEAGGWGRALVLEARRRGVHSVGLQHGFIYRHWLNYRHEPDEIAASTTPGCPIPDRTLVFDDYARSFLIDAGHFPASTVTVTGSPRLDDLAARTTAARARREAIRAALLDGAEHLCVLAAKHSEVAPALPDLVRAMRGFPGARLLIKPHPAETPDVYRPITAGARGVAIAPADTDLATLLAATDAIVTMNSTVAIDGLVLGIPALVIGLPNNLSPFVEAGVMAGAATADENAAGLRALLYDAEVRRALVDRGRQFADRFGMRADGRAADRTAAEVLALVTARRLDSRA
jgi:hypothetical protein